MTYIKRLVIHGFKSFVRKTELPFSKEINVVLGPNGSGKSNISDALCFVLGRLSMKSMRAAKAKNLIFLGSKVAAPAKEASVEIVFDNSNNAFSINSDEVSIKRIIRKSGQSIYKINNSTKTRQEVLFLLAQAGIDPNGFNLILQGQIQNFVRMFPEERRKIIEEVSGISIYESRKEKSAKELEKTEQKLKEITAILRERTAYLNNLEKERQQALRFKKLEKDIKKYKASIIHGDLTKKKKEKILIDEEIEKRKKEIEKIKKITTNIKTTITNLESKISSITNTIQKSTGLEQEQLNQEIANCRAELAGLNVKYENHENKLKNIFRQKEELEKTIQVNEISIGELQKESPSKLKSEKEIERKKQELEKLEEERKKFYTTKTELKTIRERIEDKRNLFQNYSTESDFLLKQINSISEELFDKKTTQEKLDALKISLAEKRELLEISKSREIQLEKIAHTNEYEIDKQNKIIEKIAKLDTCPLCKNKITKEHINSIHKEALPMIESLKREVEKSDKEVSEIYNRKEVLNQEIDQTRVEIHKRESDMVKLSNINDKKNQIKSLYERIELLKEELNSMKKIKENLEKNFDHNSNIEQKYETARMEFREISLRSEETVNSEILLKQRELERSKISLKQYFRDEKDIKDELKEVEKNIEERTKILNKKKAQEEILTEKFKKLISQRDDLQKIIRENEIDLSRKQNSIHNIDLEINNLRIDNAKVDAEIENLEIEILEFPNVEIIKTNKESLLEKLNKAQQIISNIGSVNMRSLEVYESIKNEYDSIKEKSDIIAKEKEDILKIIHEIDIKKKKVFLRTLFELNEIFSRNFSQLSTKGQVTLELENKKSPFEGGVNIIVKTGHGKYFDVKSLSGGEQTLVALSLIFAIQELQPYHFYILDEIDAALDKRNSERLAGMLKKYMKKGQYIVITHNDEIISNATTLYGVSMHDGISKVVSLKL